MSSQSKIDDFYQVRAMISPQNSGSAKKRTLSLKKSTPPFKSKKITDLTNPNEILEILSSDEENRLLTPAQDSVISSNNDSDANRSSEKKFSSPSVSVKSNSSTETIVYNLSPGEYFQPSPAKSSPQPKPKYYSPNKKRLVVKKNLTKKKLSFENSNVKQEKREYSESLDKACEGLDDTTIFMLRVIHDCLKKDSLKNLLDENTQNLLQSCLTCMKPGARLVCRLYWVKPGWYRLDRLSTIACAVKKQKLASDLTQEMVACLVKNGLLTSSHESELSFEEYEKLVLAPDMLKICKHFKLKCKTKEEALKVLKAYGNAKAFSFDNKNITNMPRVLQMLKTTAGQCYKLSDATRKALSQLYVLMYLGIDYSLIRHHKLELMLLNDKSGTEVSPIDKNMELDDASVVFKDKEEFARYYEAVMFRERYLETKDDETIRSLVMEAENIYKNLKFDLHLRYELPPWLLRFTPLSVYLNIMEGGVQELKKGKTEKCYIWAISILKTLLLQKTFRQHKKADWIAEKALIYRKYRKNPEKAAKVLLNGLKSELNQDTKQLMMIRAKKLANQKNITLDSEVRQELLSYAKQIVLEKNMPAEHVNKIPMETYPSQRGKLTYVIHTEEGKKYVNVEDFCIQYYVAEGIYTQGAHWEGRMVKTIFFLLFWDIIYTKPDNVQGIFLSYYQPYPLDLFTDSFYENRKLVIDDRLMHIKNSSMDTIVEMMKTTWDERPENEMSDLLRSVEWSIIEVIARCLKPSALFAICGRLANNFAYTHSGFPDVTLWNAQTKQIKIVEVKSDVDKPSIKQLQWIQYLLDNGVDAGFCYIGGNTTRSRARPSINNELNSSDDDNDDFV